MIHIHTQTHTNIIITEKSGEYETLITEIIFKNDNKRLQFYVHIVGYVILLKMYHLLSVKYSKKRKKQNLLTLCKEMEIVDHLY